MASFSKNALRTVLLLSPALTVVACLTGPSEEARLGAVAQADNPSGTGGSTSTSSSPPQCNADAGPNESIYGPGGWPVGYPGGYGWPGGYGFGTYGLGGYGYGPGGYGYGVGAYGVGGYGYGLGGYGYLPGDGLGVGGFGYPAGYPGGIGYPGWGYPGYGGFGYAGGLGYPGYGGLGYGPYGWPGVAPPHPPPGATADGGC